MFLYFMLAFHMAFGAIAIVSGIIAPFANKRGTLHKQVGQIYLISMLILGISGVIVAIEREIVISFFNGIVVCYLVLSSWLTLKRQRVGLPEYISIAVATFLVLGLGYFTYSATLVEGGKISGFGSETYGFFALVCLVALIGDIKLVLKNGIQGRYRILRHLWRMLFPLFMATAAFFLGQAKLFPEGLRKIELLAIPVVFIIGLLFYWVLRVRLLKHYA